MRKKNKKVLAVVTDKAANKIITLVSSMQNAFALYLNKRTKHFSPLAWKCLIILSAISWAVAGSYFISKHYSPRRPPFISRSIHKDSLYIIEKMYEQRKANH